MRNKFDEQLLELNQEMTKMGNMIEESIAKAVRPFIREIMIWQNRLWSQIPRLTEPRKKSRTSVLIF